MKNPWRNKSYSRKSKELVKIKEKKKEKVNPSPDSGPKTSYLNGLILNNY